MLSVQSLRSNSVNTWRVIAVFSLFFSFYFVLKNHRPFCFWHPMLHIFYFIFHFSSNFNGLTVKYWVCVAEGIKHLCSLQVMTAHSLLGNKGTSPHRYNRRRHRSQTSSMPRQPCNSHSQGVLCLWNFPLVYNILLFDVRVFWVHECIWLGRGPREENLPTHWKMLLKLFKLVVDRGNCHSPKRGWIWK